MTIELWIAYVIACAVVAVVPGPTVTVIIANSVRHGTSAGIANIAGTQLGVSIALGVLLVGLASVMEFVSQWFFVLKLIGAAYLVWLGVKMWRSDGKLAIVDAGQRKDNFFLQGFLVAMSNPKIMLFFGAFIPQFIDPAKEPLFQIIVLGITFMAVATFFDVVYAVLAGKAGSWLTTRRVKLVERVSGSLLMAGGLWMALARR